MEYIPVIGLEVHAQLATKTKCFCGCSTKFGQKANSATCPVCLGLPGSLPALNEYALKLAVKAAIALHCCIADVIKFDRKHYFYPDLPKNFQISQYDLPIGSNGSLTIESENKPKKINIKRVHLEEDAGKLAHQEKGESLVDYNRAGTPLLEIVSQPDISSPQEAYIYLTFLKSILEYLEVSDCNMEEGSLRCDANISVKPIQSPTLGEKVELKNMNSFKGIKQALEFEFSRQSQLLAQKEKIIQETRLWDTVKCKTVSMRSKEDAHDYRYFFEPDLAPFVLDKSYLQQITQSLPELPKERSERFVKTYNIPSYDANVLTSDKYLAEYFEECVRLYPNPKIISNWIMTELLSHLNTRGITIRQLALQPKNFVAIFPMMDKGAISGKIAKEILPQLLDGKNEAENIVKEKGMQQISSTDTLEQIAREVIQENPQPVTDYYQGKEKACMFLVGQIMRKSRGKANPQIVNEILKKTLERSGGDA
ncbi:MAG: Asp-tRNA(Asn)/Glu-tRNA(Gln) amidotransferase subunit GatB [Candidatus Omnitrophota bacterium]